MDKLWEQEDKLIHVAYYATTLGMNRKFAYNLVDRALRAASDVLSAECVNVVNNTASVIQWTTQWSEAAMDEYARIDALLTEKRGGKPPTHRQITQWRDCRGKRPFTVEHEYPILIPKKGVLDDKWTEEQLNVWMWKYGRATIITHPENDRLLNHKADMQIASKRYKTANINVLNHPNFKENLC